MRNNSRHTTEIIKAGVLLGFGIFFISCIFKVKKCPLPTCEIRKTHRHLLIFSDAPKEKKKLFGFLKKKEKTDSASLAADSLHASDTTHAHKGKNKKNTNPHDASFVEVDGTVLDEEGNIYVDPKVKKKQDKEEAKKAKKEAKKQKKIDKKAAKGKYVEQEADTTVIALDEEDDDYAGMSEEEYKYHRQHNTKLDTTEMHQYDEKELAKQLKKEDKANKKKQKKEDKAIRKGKKGQADYTRLYRSRITKWWRKDQNPKIGKYFKRQNDDIPTKKKGIGHLFDRLKKD